MIRVKICGITCSEDALAAAAAGADAIGLVFVAGSRRCVSVEQAAAICLAVPPFLTRVGLFVNAEPGDIAQILGRVSLDCLQFHGDESPEYCAAFQRPWIKALAMGADLLPDWRPYAGADALLFDSHGGGKLGGSGKTFDWSRLQAPNRPWILAGGLSPDNVAGACQVLQPDAVDVSSGVEIEPGIKDHKRMQAFIEAVRHG